MDKKSLSIAFSICIPIYNWDVRKLILELHRQASLTNCLFEILLIDDCSASFKEENRQLQQLTQLSYIELKENIGRSRIRNLLAKTAQYPYLIFMDCDTEINNPSYLQNYLNEIPADVVVGNCQYTSVPPERVYLLRWRYGICREQRNASQRNKQPNKSFSAFNFMIQKKIFDRIQFDENLSSYGHEDTLFGWKLKKQNIRICHIDNPLIHSALDNSKDFIEKTENSVKNLWLIYQTISESEKNEFAQDNDLLKYSLWMQKRGLSDFISLIFKIFRYPLYKNLLSKHPQMFFFDLYKLGYLHQWQRTAAKVSTTGLN
ncbi:MAG: glycosyltransferase [Candidatus Azobacteroides sp.]|nr:glycosyltransferase [Candidatus Azobacteroides sp.]